MGLVQTYCTICAGPFEKPDIEEVHELMKLRGLNMQNFNADNLRDLDWLIDPVGIDLQERQHDLSGYKDCYEGGLEVCDQQNSDNENLKDDDEYASAYQFYSKSAHVYDYADGAPYGLIIHKSCQQILKDHLHYDVKFADVFGKICNLDSDIGDAVSEIDHTVMKFYAQQDFRFDQMISDNNIWLIQDPVTNKQNCSRIVKCWSPLVKNIQG